MWTSGFSFIVGMILGACIQLHVTTVSEPIVVRVVLVESVAPVESAALVALSNRVVAIEATTQGSHELLQRMNRTATKSFNDATIRANARVRRLMILERAVEAKVGSRKWAQATKEVDAELTALIKTIKAQTAPAPKQ